MLELMRKQAGNWIIKIILGVIALAFALSFGLSPNFGGTQGVAMKVNDQSISEENVSELYGRLVEQARRQYGDNFDKIAEMLNLRQQALYSIMDRVLLSQAALEMGLGVSDREVALAIQQNQAFLVEGRFNMERYRQVLAANHLNEARYEDGVRGDLMQSKLAAMIGGTGQVTPLQVDQALTAALGQAEALYLIIKPEDLLNSVKVDPEQVATHYEANKGRYMNPATIQIDYVVLPVARFRDQAQVADEDIVDAYEMDWRQYSRPEEVHARHILVKLTPDADDKAKAEAKAKAQALLAQVKAGADFAKLARENSQGPSADKGGDLGYFQRGQMVGAFDDVVFKMTPGQTELVETEFGWHVVRLEDKKKARIVPLEEVRGEIKARLAEQQAKELAMQAADGVFDGLAGGKALDDAAKEQKLNVEHPAAVSADQPIPGLPGLKDLFKAAEGIEAGQPLRPMPFDGGAVVAVVRQRAGAQPKPLAEVREQAELAAREQKAIEEAKRQAQELLQKLAAEKDPAEALRKLGAKSTGLVTAGQEIKDLPGARQLQDAIHALARDKAVLEQPVTVGGGFAVAVVTQRKPPEAAVLEQMRQTMTQELRAQYQQEVFQRFLADRRSAAEILVPQTAGDGGWKIPGCDRGPEVEWVRPAL